MATDTVSLRGHGEAHKEHNQDQFIVKYYGDYTISAVFDGCSSGTDAHIAAWVLKTALKDTLESMSSVSELEVLFLQKVRNLQQVLNLKVDEMLATVIISIHNFANGNLTILYAGDGAYKINDEELVVLQNTAFQNDYPYDYTNMPNYMAYNLDDPDYKLKRVTFENVDEYLIATDGILSFPSGAMEKILDKTWTLPLRRKVASLVMSQGARHHDDLTIVWDK